MKIAIIGYGVEGRAAYAYWQAGNDITICDQNANLGDTPEDVTLQLGDNYLHDLETFDLVVRSPFVRPDALIHAGVDPAKITSNTNEFFRVCPTKNIIGVTGTKGKGTTSTLITALLRASGKTVHLGGNIGVPALSLLNESIHNDHWVVLELSSFQLIDLQYSPPYAVCLMVVPEHQDWHTDINEYMNAKKQLFHWQQPSDRTVYFADNGNSVAVAAAGHGIKIPYFAEPGARVEHDHIVIDSKKICSVHDLKLLGAHNWQNICAALTVTWLITQDIAPLRETLKTFTGLPYRLEYIREHNHVQYYNDSFGTTPETAIVAIQAFTEPKVLILGGSDKGADYSELAQTIASNTIRRVLLIGQQADRLQQALDRVGFTNYQAGGDTMSEIVATATAVAEAGDIVLLSTGCASFDMFTDYKDRGNQFNQAVQALSANVQ